MGMGPSANEPCPLQINEQAERCLGRQAHAWLSNLDPAG